MRPTAIDILPLTPERLPDFLDFFEHRAFVDNPKWLSCFCHFPHADHANIVWKERTATENRAATCARIEAGTMTGWLAYADGLSIGWCNAGPRRFIAGLFDEPEPLADRIGAIACFVIAPAFRGKHVATRLLHAACDGLRTCGFEWAEAYPRPASVNAAEHHHGPLAMYEAAGFGMVKREADGGLVVRKRLDP
ncbi:MAG: GNAT family N-acetyltransferase [Pseudomonadota bacterium]|nr:GNAT family N-acetyltransferase [Pseudomonadota bacterium]